MARFSITSQIGIDMGHRVPTHGSKCYSLHGHRYTILATASAEALGSSEQSGMVMDFSFLKACMMEYIDAHFDHAMCLWVDDEILGTQLLAAQIPYVSQSGRRDVRAAVEKDGIWHCKCIPEKRQHKVVVVDFIPTAELLAKHWFEVLEGEVHIASQGRARLDKIVVYETPNNSAEYPT